MLKLPSVFLLILALPLSAPAATRDIAPVRAWMMLPFFALLLAITIVPLVNRHWWERYYPHLSFGLGFLVLSYYSFLIDYHRMLDTALEYFSFIVLIGSLFVASGGIVIHTQRRATPALNTLILTAGALLSNIVGTTGASMLFIRPFLRINKSRLRPFHVVFFIFLVSNLGGALTPIGDPPLLLGYLNGVPFHWPILNIWPIWLTALLILLALFFVLDSHSFSRWSARQDHPETPGRIHLHGARSFVFLLIILAAVFTASPYREIIMIAAAGAAYRFARKDALRANEFSFAPIREVAILFAGIFATMVPALDWLNLNAGQIGLKTPGQFYWASGILSGLLDNVPTYLTFLSAALGLHGLTLGNHGQMGILIAQHGRFLLAISVGSVFFGAGTYIGNGPNFMVKSIAEHLGVKCPSFFGYILKYSLPILLPTFLIIWLIFFR
jgi:Na+/H+ antiporter NhaD/arsenite permease-like protein